MPTPTKGPRLGKGPAHEHLILRSLCTALIEKERITTTETKAKRCQAYAEKVITKAISGGMHDRRQVLRFITDKSVVHKLFTDIGPRLEGRPGGHTRITKLGPRRGDNAPMAVIEILSEPYSPRQQVLAEAEASKGSAAEKAAAEQPQAQASRGQTSEETSEDTAPAEDAVSAEPVTEASDGQEGDAETPAEAGQEATDAEVETAQKTD